MPTHSADQPAQAEQLALFEPGDVLSGPGMRDNEAQAQSHQGTPSPDQ
jgi:hypothetical protein